jgi:hypothetical protein
LFSDLLSIAFQFSCLFDAHFCEMHSRFRRARERLQDASKFSQDIRLWSFGFSGDAFRRSQNSVLIEVRCFHNLIIFIREKWKRKSLVNEIVHSHASRPMFSSLLHSLPVTAECFTLLLLLLFSSNVYAKEETEKRDRVKRETKMFSVTNVLLIASAASFGSFYSFFWSRARLFLFPKASLFYVLSKSFDLNVYVQTIIICRWCGCFDFNRH